MHRSPMPLLMLCLCATVIDGAERKPPYDAIVDVEKEYVRSGNGRNFYPTSELKRGDRVTVRRHDPGGWVMIDPPPGSFSWIKADHVRRTQSGTGVLNENGVIVRVGSQFNDDHEWYQRELSKGDTVEILGEKTFETDRGPIMMLKIKPPANEYRWIMGKALRPVNSPEEKPRHEGEVAKREPEKQAPTMPPKTDDAKHDPFEDGPAPKPDFGESIPISRSEPSVDEEPETLRAPEPDTAENQALRGQLAAVDEAFRNMIKGEPPTWDLISLEQQYRQIEREAGSPKLQTQVKQRLDAVGHYSKIKKEYDEFLRISTETKQRDAQLMSLSNQPEAPLGKAEPAQPPAPPSSRRGTPPPGPPKYDGAGVIQRTISIAQNAPQYVLVAPNGRFLAYLQPAPGVDLKPYVGQSMGVFGQRSFRQELRADLIVVRGLQPVRLKGGM